MPHSISQLIAALPEGKDDATHSGSFESTSAEEMGSFRPVPIGRFRRMTALGTLQARIGAAYLFHWLRGWFESAEENERRRAELNWRTALQMLDSMNYLRGAIMKIGQTLANFPDIAPREFVETLEQLHFNAPPMHWALLREMVNNELGDDPKNVFLEFDKRAFAAASLGQVHRARSRNGEEIAVKIQYPGIANSIRSDFRNLFMFLLPAKLNQDWQNTKEQFEDLRKRLEIESDYHQEALYLAKARRLFREDDGIVIPKVYSQYSTRRILTMERLEGVHLTEFAKRGPSQEERNDVARKLLRAWYRMMYSGRMLYSDFHPGNFLVMDDGRLGVIDFGFIMPYDQDEWELLRKMHRPLISGQRADRVSVLKEWSGIADEETDRLRLSDEFAQWCWMSRSHDGAFDFSDEADFRRGVELFVTMVRRRYTRSRPNTPVITRCQFGWRALLYLLKAKVDLRPIAEEEVAATGWDLGGFASRS